MTDGRTDGQPDRRTAGGVSRRAALGALAAVPLGTLLDWSPAQRAGAAAYARTAAQGAAPRFFTAHEWETLRLLVDLILPRDERSGSATDAGVPEYLDFLMMDGGDDQRTAMRGGLAWLDIECRKRFGKTLVACAPDERTGVLDTIAWPAKAPPDLSHGAAFFSRLRDLTASGFWSSRMGVEDLQYQGNTFVAEWTGCPPEALTKLGVRYPDA